MKNIAIIGGGQIFETVHLKAIQATAGIKEIHVVEPNSSRREELKQKYLMLTLHSDIDSLLASSKIDDAIVCVPNKFHHSTTIKLLSSGINVLCEKPPAITAQEANEMWKCAAENEVKLFYNFHLRQIECYDQLKEASNSAYFVDIKALRRRGIPGWGSFINKDVQGGGALIDLGIHYLDLVLLMLECYDFDSIQALTDDYIGKNEMTGDFGDWDNNKFTVENFCSATLKSEFLLNLNTSFAHNIAEKDIYDVTVYTHSGRVEVLKQKSFDTENKLKFDLEKELDQQTLRINSSLQFLNETYKNMCDGEQGYKIQSLIEKIYESAGK